MVGRISGIIIEMRERYRIPILENELETCKKQTQNAGRILEVFRQVSNLIDVREDANQNLTNTKKWREKGMNRKDSVKYAMHSMEMEGFNFTPDEKAMWEKIAADELPMSEARVQGEAFDKLMRSKFPEKYVSKDE